MVANPHVLRATNRTGLFPRLEALQAELTLCEKTLAEYLETKRLAFPRFYFVSTADLLDILSNGNQPVKVTRLVAAQEDFLLCAGQTYQARPGQARPGQLASTRRDEAMELCISDYCKGIYMKRELISSLFILMPLEL